MSNCLFCKIVKNEIPSAKIYEDEKILAFLDINPVNPGHSLVIPKEHFKDASSTPDDLLSNLTTISKKIGQALIKSGIAEGFILSTNNGKAAGQEIFHTHFHIIPRKLNDELTHWEQKKYQEGEMEEVAEKIKEIIT